MAQAVSRRSLTAETRVRSRFNLCGICGGQNGTGTGFFPEYFGFPLSISFHRCSITWKNEKILIIFLFIFITGLRNKAQGCGAYVASAAGPLPPPPPPKKKEWAVLKEELLFTTCRISFHSQLSARRQTAQRSPLFQFSVTQFPHVLLQSIAVNIRVMLTIFKEGAGNFLFGSQACIKSDKHSVRCKSKFCWQH
jgi:hypothetical protein